MKVTLNLELEAHDVVLLEAIHSMDADGAAERLEHLDALGLTCADADGLLDRVLTSLGVAALQRAGG